MELNQREDPRDLFVIAAAQTGCYIHQMTGFSQLWTLSTHTGDFYKSTHPIFWEEVWIIWDGDFLLPSSCLLIAEDKGAIIFPAPPPLPPSRLRHFLSTTCVMEHPDVGTLRFPSVCPGREVRELPITHHSFFPLFRNVICGMKLHRTFLFSPLLSLPPPPPLSPLPPPPLPSAPDRSITK